ncbi:MAG: hypothetical protein IKP04_02240 [Candidatus Methanomethylophilaceae archaeon]|nr:hypothetical protein [Candidatus Methanomethylophilaceae archaeon]
MTTYLRNKERLKDNGQTLTDFAKSIPFAVSDLEFAPKNNDLVMDGPLSEPDIFFLRRQARAFPSGASVRSGDRESSLFKPYHVEDPLGRLDTE